MKKPKISIEDASRIASLIKETGYDKKADIYNPSWKMDLLSMTDKRKGSERKK